MITKYNRGDKIWLQGTIENATDIKEKIYYKIKECEALIPEDVCTNGTINMKLKTDIAQMDGVINKAEEFKKILTEAMEIAYSIASLNLDLQINAVVNDKPTELARITTE